MRLRELPKEVLPLIAGKASARLGDARLCLAILMRGAGCGKEESLHDPRLENVHRTLMETNPSLMWSIAPRARTLEHYFNFASQHAPILSWLSEQTSVDRHLEPEGEDLETEPRWLQEDREDWPGIPKDVPREEVGLAVHAWELIQEGATWQTTNPRDFYMAVIEHNADAIMCMPPIHLDHAFYLAAFDANPGVIAYFPRALVTQAVANDALEADPELLIRIPPDVYPIDHWVQLVGERLEVDGYRALEHVDGSILTEVSQGLIARDPSNILALNAHRTLMGRLAPRTERTQILEQIAEATNRQAVALDPALFTEIAPHLRLESVCLAAVSGNGMLLEDVPDAHRTLKVCEAAARQNPMAVAWVPEALQAQVEAALARAPT